MITDIIKAGAGMAVSALNKKQAQQDQLSQNEKLMGQQEQSNMRMTKFNNEQALQFWKDTNYSAQMDELEKAGLNPALIYGQGGAGGGTAMSVSGNVNGATAEGPSQSMAIQNAAAMQIANLGLIQAQTEKTKAETVNLGATTGETNEDIVSKKFANDLNKAIGINDMLWNWKAADNKLQTSAEKEMAEWNAAKAAGFRGMATDNQNSPMAKAITAGFEKTITDLENAKKEGNLKDAEQIIKNFEAKMAESGLSPKSPWYVKFIGDALDKVGLNPMTNGTLEK